MSDAQGKLKSLKKKVKDDVEKLEKKIRALASKVTSAASLGPAVVVDVLQMPAASMACLCSYFFYYF
jgi:membrane protein insertase Oxa1/YidC/SpoIIIJ